MMCDYKSFLANKRIIDPLTGIDNPGKLNSALFPHQRDITRWALRRGRAAIFAGTGLGKTIMELVWAEKVSAHTSKPVLIFAPLAVTHQHVREAERFGLKASVATHQDAVSNGIHVTNYAKMDRFDLNQFGGVVLDESSIIKSHDGKTRQRLIDGCRDIPFRLAATATPSPNDFMELGNHAEFLGVMSYSEMLSMFFIHDGGDTQKWRLKGHSNDDFWKWLASWSVMMQKPSDLGYPDDGYILPPIKTVQHTVSVEYKPDIETGMLFPVEARTMSERLGARRSSIEDRVNAASDIVAAKTDVPWILWCNLNDESSMLASTIPGAVEVRGSDKEEDKERKLTDFASGKIRVLITKPSIAGFGCNWQHCADAVFVGLNDSFEQVFQAIRRCWRFGQKNPVTAHFIASEIEGAVVSNLRRKEAAAEHMAAGMLTHMKDITSENLKGSSRDVSSYVPTTVSLPEFMRV